MRLHLLRPEEPSSQIGRPRATDQREPEPEQAWNPRAIFDSYAPYVAAIATRVLGRADEVEDLVQEVFLVVVSGVYQLRNPEAIKGWLATVTVRLAMRRLRWRRLRGWLRLDGPQSYEDLPDPRLSGEERAAVAFIYRLLDRSSPAHRTAWVLHHGEGMPIADVAIACGCSPATAKRWIAAVNEKVRRSIIHG
jgi:RNA polymerase sigma-70 factor (ECF subfamily)